MIPKAPKNQPRYNQSSQRGILVTGPLLLFAVSSCFSTCVRAESLESRSRAAVCFEIELPAGPWRFTFNLCSPDVSTIEVGADRQSPCGEGPLGGKLGGRLEIELDPDPKPRL